jgi:spermidine/putrescine transport system substrate-binding protein
MKKMILTKLAVVVCFALIASSCSKKEKLYIYNWTYYTPQTVLEKFTDEYGIEIVEDNYDSNEIMYNKLKAGGTEYDVIFPSCDYVSIMIQQNMLHKLDRSKMTNLENIDPEILKRADWDPEMDYAVPYYWGAAGLSVNISKVPEFERSWNLISREDLKGKVTMLDDMREVLGDALAYLGYSLNTKDPDQVAEARDFILNDWRKNIKRLDAELFGKNYASGEFWVVQGYGEGIFTEIAGNQEMIDNTAFFIPKEGGPSYIDSMCIPKDAKNVDAAHKFIDFIHRPEIYAEFCDTFHFPATANSAARLYLKETPMYNIEELLPTEVKKDLGDALDIYNQAWDEIRMRIGD